MSTAEVCNEDMRRKALKTSGDDLIRRRDVINAIFDTPIADLFDVTVKKSDLVSAVIQIQPECKKGKWTGKSIAGVYVACCSVCGKAFIENDGRWSFCPSCGADMREEEM